MRGSAGGSHAQSVTDPSGGRIDQRSARGRQRPRADERKKHAGTGDQRRVDQWFPNSFAVSQRFGKDDAKPGAMEFVTQASGIPAAAASQPSGRTPLSF